MEDRPIQYTYPLDMPLKDKINAIATKIYRADGVNYSAAASKTLAELTEMGYGDLPVCIAKTQYSFSDNAKLTGAPTGFTMEVREVRLAAGAGFVVVICGSIMTMPGLPRSPPPWASTWTPTARSPACSDPIKKQGDADTLYGTAFFVSLFRHGHDLPDVPYDTQRVWQYLRKMTSTARQKPSPDKLAGLDF